MGIPRYPKDMMGEWQRTQRDIKNLFTSANVRKALTRVNTGILEISGELTVVPGGKLNSQYTNGNSALYVGTVTDGNNVGEGVILRRGDGSEVLHLEGFSDEDSTFSILDKNGEVIFADDEQGGLSSPYIPYTFVDVINVPSNATGSFVTVNKAWIHKQHPRINLAYYQNTTSTAGEIQFVIEGGSANGTTLSTIVTSTGNTTAELGAIDLPGNYLESFYINVQTRVTSGAGIVACAILGAYGVKST